MGRIHTGGLSSIEKHWGQKPHVAFFLSRDQQEEHQATSLTSLFLSTRQRGSLIYNQELGLLLVQEQGHQVIFMPKSMPCSDDKTSITDQCEWHQAFNVHGVGKR